MSSPSKTSQAAALAAVRRSPAASHLYFDQPRSLFGDSLRQRVDKFVDRGDDAAGNAHAPGERNPVERGAGDRQHVPRAPSWFAGADTIEFAAQDLIDAVREHDGQNVEALAVLRPQRL